MSLFSYDNHIEEIRPNILQSHVNSQAVLLLSQIKNIDRDVVENLERSGVYDTEDFVMIAPRLVRDLNFPKKLIEEIEYEIEIAKRSMMEFPRNILKFPQNYALICAFSDKESYYLGLYWRGLTVKLACLQIEGWKAIELQFQELSQKMNYPELIGRISIENIPFFLQDLTPLSTYISNLPFDQMLLDIALAWGLNPPSKDLDDLDLELMALYYLIKLAELGG